MASIIHSDQRIFKTFAKTETLIRDNYFTNIFRTHISKHDQNSETPDPKISKNMVNVKNSQFMTLIIIRKYILKPLKI